jgi:prephenate dehydrogenase
MADPARTEAATRLPDRICFLGLGLIGGSVALALREAGYRGHLVAWTPNGRGPAEALRRGAIDEATTDAASAIDGAGLVVFAGPVPAILNGLGSLAGRDRQHLASDATVTDVGSSKGLIVERAGASQLPFVGGHPMAGRETSGLEAATADLFIDRPWAIVPADSARPVDIDRVDALAAATGARSVRIDADAHDRAVAAISHLPLVLSAALVEAVTGSTAAGAGDWPAARRLAAGGWRDMTRLAKGDPEMGAGMLSTNTDALLAQLRELRRVLDNWIDGLDPQQRRGGDAAWIEAQLDAARRALEARE